MSGIIWWTFKRYQKQIKDKTIRLINIKWNGFATMKRKIKTLSTERKIQRWEYIYIYDRENISKTEYTQLHKAVTTKLSARFERW